MFHFPFSYEIDMVRKTRDADFWSLSVLSFMQCLPAMCRKDQHVVSITKGYEEL